MATVTQRPVKEKNPETELELQTNPLDGNRNPLQVLLFLFMQKLIVAGTKGPLEMADMFALPHHDLSTQTWKRVEKEFERERNSITEADTVKRAAPCAPWQPDGHSMDLVTIWSLI